MRFTLLITPAAILWCAGLVLALQQPNPPAHAAGSTKQLLGFKRDGIKWTLIMHGSADRTVRPAKSADFQGILCKNGVANERRVFEGKDRPIDQTRREEVFGLMRKWSGPHLNVASPGDGVPSPATAEVPSRRDAPPKGQPNRTGSKNSSRPDTPT